MQRVAVELHEALRRHQDVEMKALLLRSSWAWTHVKTPFFLMKVWYRLREAIREEEIDAVLFSSMVTGTVALPLRALADAHNVKFAAICHGRDVTLPVAPYQWLVPRVFDALDMVFPVSSATRDACLERGVLPSIARVIPNGVDLTRFNSSPEIRKKARQALLASTGTSAAPLHNDDFVLLSVGRQVERKGFEWFVRNVMPLLPQDVHYWLAGDGPENENIQDAIDEMGMRRRVRLMGRVKEKELEGLYHGTDLFIMPNILIPGDIEGFGVVMLEAGQCGLPTVASKIEGISDVIKEGKNGHLVEHRNPHAFAEAIMRYVNKSNGLGDASSRAASYVRETFTWSTVGSRYVAALKEITSQSSA